MPGCCGFACRYCALIIAPQGTALVFADDTLLVFDKPADLLSVPGRGADKQDCLSARVMQHFADARIVHRLDMATSGLLLMARGAANQRILSLAFANRQVEKNYEALVDAMIEPAVNPDEWQSIDLPIALDWPRRPLRIIDPAQGKPSQTLWRLITHEESLCASRLLLAPVTGRSHQLRVHLAAIGHPILGDTLYAPSHVAARSQRMLLHATRLQLAHPVTRESLRFDSPAPF
ncbi:MAG: RNA pseudouridine synthase [Comamonadaceae bacterium CG_4_9_14_0_8_um_filter_60_18]|nr:MAG: RNA pseudouridine synthase [Comamonadaceae bacterium CG17_big_fil_post_rev_8_21_14_2_50_60_13]PIY25399.1 MAG: RNA pseudouridine synthase [Comamonadaceae bacterium CG_4_10_14_3_um_filter_60_75]PJC12096.1 MAG: RNA pseudouridine synthase [Comamonadaceae bacterium CG_4_9_14_0_8_um_filter_60_18]